ncbi:MAG: Sensor histidine kinase [Lachnoclostridium sp.]|jgi:two-component system, LytTR family, sensor histidine kinase AgrC
MIVWIIIEYLAALLQCFISTEFVTGYLGFKENKTKKWTGFTAAFLAQASTALAMKQISVFEGVTGFICLTVTTIVVSIYAFFYLNGSIYEKIILVCIDSVLKLIIGMSVFVLIRFLSPLEMFSLIKNKGMERFLVLLMSISSYFFCTRIILRLRHNNKFALTIEEWLAILSVFITSFAAGVLVFEMLLTSPGTRQNYYYAVMIMVCLIIVNVLCHSIFARVNTKSKERLQYTLLELRLKEQEKNLAEMKRSYEEIRKIRHDMKNYVECAISLLHSGKTPEAENYLSSLLENKINFGRQMVYSNNDALNAVLNSKIGLCQEYGIVFQYEITGSVENISELDISILMANLLDNAIESSKKLKEGRKISLKIYNEKNYLVIQVNNYTGKSVLSKNPNLLTTKRDKLHHGIGSLSIKDIVKKYNGIMSIYEKDGYFCVDIWLNQGTDNERNKYKENTKYA